MSHLTVFLLMALLVSSARSFIGDRGMRERVHSTIYVFLMCVLSIAGGSWFMYLVHR
jgi:hypothetical protein